MGRPIFFPKSAPSSGKLDFPFPVQNFSKCQGAALGRKGLENQYFAISRPWGSGWPKHQQYKSCAISGGNFWGGRIFPPKVPLAPGYCVFPFLARNFSECQGLPKGLKCQYFAISCPWGSGRPKHKMQKTCAILGRNFWGVQISPQKCP